MSELRKPPYHEIELAPNQIRYREYSTRKMKNIMMKKIMRSLTMRMFMWRIVAVTTEPGYMHPWHYL